MTQKICRICQKNFSKYTCPRCSLQYCSLDCYKKHSDRCTEGFYSEHVSDELRQTRASEEEKQQMLEILRRVHDADAAELPAAAEYADEDAGGPGNDDGGLSEQTIARLLEKAERGQELQVVMEDLTPEERAAFEAELASGALAQLVIPWEPWWRSAEAQHLSLSNTGTRIIQVAETGSSALNAQPQEPGIIPEPPEDALPRLAALSSAIPSPLLQWQLVEILYAYCTVMQLYQGVWASDAVGAALAASAATVALEGHFEGPPFEPPASALLALTDCISRGCMPSLHGPGGRELAVAVMEDVKALISCGRPAVVCAITDLRRLYSAAADEVKSFKKAASHSKQMRIQGSGAAVHLQSSRPLVVKRVEEEAGSAAPAGQRKQMQEHSRGEDEKGGVEHADSVQGFSAHSRSKSGTYSPSTRVSGGKRLRQKLQAAERRLVYFQSWANEQMRDAYQEILDAVVEASQAFEHSQDLPDAPTARLADLGRVQMPGLGYAEGQNDKPRPLLQELDGSGSATPPSTGCNELRNEMSFQEYAGKGVQLDALD